MKYERPTISLVATALAVVQGHDKGGPDNDGISVTPAAYEADE
jgi:hypothetical protein